MTFLKLRSGCLVAAAIAAISAVAEVQAGATAVASGVAARAGAGPRVAATRLAAAGRRAAGGRAAGSRALSHLTGYLLGHHAAADFRHGVGHAHLNGAGGLAGNLLGHHLVVLLNVLLFHAAVAAHLALDFLPDRFAHADLAGGRHLGADLLALGHGAFLVDRAVDPVLLAHGVRASARIVQLFKAAGLLARFAALPVAAGNALLLHASVLLPVVAILHDRAGFTTAFVMTHSFRHGLGFRDALDGGANAFSGHTHRFVAEALNGFGFAFHPVTSTFDFVPFRDAFGDLDGPHGGTSRFGGVFSTQRRGKGRDGA